MASVITQDFSTQSVTRSRADRFADAVIAGYINALAASASSAQPRVVEKTPSVEEPLPAIQPLYELGHYVSPRRSVRPSLVHRTRERLVPGAPCFAC